MDDTNHGEALKCLDKVASQNDFGSGAPDKGPNAWYWAAAMKGLAGVKVK